MSRWWEHPNAFTPADFLPVTAEHDGDYACGCEHCARMSIVLTYMFEAMEPTDRALRMPGDTYPARRPA
jgi:hypothetical protein